ncbi:MAG: O-antigen ligase family protein [Propionibacteriaceae bacterium]|nr:O-antigen ligase family protein [Propionibacteriaceae bacterium]
MSEPLAATKTSPRPGILVSWCLVPTLLLLGLVDSRQMPNGQFGPWTIFLLASGLAATLGTAIVLFDGAWRRTSRGARIALVAFTLLIVVACASAFTHQQLAYDRLGNLGTVIVPHEYVVFPLLSALAACLLGWVFASGTGLPSLPQLVAAMGWSMLGVVVVALVRMGLRGTLGQRLTSAFAGAASLHLALLFGLAGFLGLAISGYRPRLHLAGAAATLLAIVLTGSRTGVAMAALLVVALVFRWRPPRYRTGLRIAAMALTIGGILAVTMWLPQLNRLFSFTDHYRAQNYATGLNAWTTDAVTMIFGNGQGTVWPWAAYEQGLVPFRADWDLPTPWGPALPSAHSTWIWALVELGLVGLLVLLVAVAPTVWAGLRPGTPPLVQTLGLAVVLSLVAFATDTHLVKNFPVAVVWWFGAFVVLRLARNSRREASPVSERK